MFELCLMCVGVIMYVCIVWVVYGVVDLKMGVCGSVIDVFVNLQLNYYIEVMGGVFVDECGVVLKLFFVECCCVLCEVWFVCDVEFGVLQMLLCLLFCVCMVFVNWIWFGFFKQV